MRMAASGGILDLQPLTNEVAIEIVRERMKRLVWDQLTSVSCPSDQPVFPFREDEIYQLRKDADGSLRTFLEKVRAAYLEKLDCVVNSPPSAARLHSLFPVEALSHEPTRVTIRGERLPLAVEVYFGEAPAQHITTHPEKGTIEVTTPTGITGSVEVRVVNADSKQELGRLEFTFLEQRLPPLCDRVDRKKLRDRREALKLSQTLVAQKLNTYQQRIGKFERGQAGLDDHELETMAQLYGQSIRDYIKRDGQ